MCSGVGDKGVVMLDYSCAFQCKSCGWGFLGVSVAGGSGGCGWV